MQRRNLPVLDSTMPFLADGSGPLVMLLHGNPTSSHLWRNVIANLAGLGYHVIAVELIGMGRSGPSGRGYRVVDHLTYLEAFVDTLGAPKLSWSDMGGADPRDVLPTPGPGVWRASHHRGELLRRGRAPRRSHSQPQRRRARRVPHPPSSMRDREHRSCSGCARSPSVANRPTSRS